LADDAARIAELEARLAAAERTIVVLSDAAERSMDPTDRVALVGRLSGFRELVTARREELERSEAWFRTLWDASPDALLLVDDAGLVVTQNQAGLALELRGRFESLFSEPEVARGVLAGTAGPGTSLALSDGRPVHVARSTVPGTPVLSLLVVRDLSLYQAMEQELQVSRRLAAVGELAGLVAAEVNGPLAVILGSLEMVREVREPDQQDRHLERIQSSAWRVEQIVRSLEVFRRHERGELAQQGLRGLVKTASERAGRRLQRTRVVVQCPKGFELYGDHELLCQAVTTLLLEFSQRARRVSVTGSWTHAAAQIQIASAPTAGTTSWIPARQAQVLRLGYLVAESIVAEHGGRMLIDESSGAVRVELPRSTGFVPVHDESSLAILHEPWTERAGPVSSLLRQMGYDVKLVADDAEVVGLLREGIPDLLVYSCVRSAKSQAERMARVVELYPDLEGRVVFILGGSQEATGLPGPHVRRPVRALDLHIAVATIQDG
jgi:signal transduction histidine kinase